MSNAGLYVDRNPETRTAGKAFTLADESAVECLTFEERPATPPHVKTWRKSLREEVGKVVVHPGLLGDAQPEVGQGGHGKPNFKDASVSDVMAANQLSEVQQTLMDKAEAIYETSRKEPLGKPYHRQGHVLPEVTKTAEFEFGYRPPEVQCLTAAESMNPADPFDKEDSAGAIHEQYIRSHNLYNTGEQTRRNYDWPEHRIKDPANFGFGVEQPIVASGAGVGQAMNPSEEEQLFVDAKNLNDYKEYSGAQFGTVLKYSEESGYGLGAAHAHGAPSKSSDQSTALCFTTEKGNETLERDLGQSVTPGWRNTADGGATGDALRKFGVPSVRIDLAAPKSRSVSDFQNYGDEPPGGRIIFPSKYSTMGVTELDFQAAFDKADLKEIVALAFPEIDEQGFEAAFEQASSDGATCSVNAFAGVI